MGGQAGEGGPKDDGKSEGVDETKASAPLRQDSGARTSDPGPRPVKHLAAGARCVFGVSEADRRWEVESSERRPRPGLQDEDPEAGRREDPPRCGGRDREVEAGSRARGEEPGGAGSQPLAPRAPAPRTWNFRLLQGFGPSARRRSQRRPASLTLDRNPSVRTAAPGSADFEPLLRLQASGSAQRAAPASRAPHAPARLRPRHGRRQLLARRPPAPQPGRQHLAAAQHRSHPGIYQGRGDPRLLSGGSRRPKRKGAGKDAGRAGRLHQGARGRS